MTEDPASVDRQLELIDGLVLTGGHDYAPALYGAEPHPKLVLIHPARQFYDLELARGALRRGIPILGICGGIQLLNIVCGGTLIQHVPDLGTPVKHAGSGRLVHDVIIEPASSLARIVGKERLAVNSAHHQAVGRVGSGLRIAAHCIDGVIEAVESAGDTFLLGVQWHPERLARERPDQLALFKALVDASSRRTDAA